MTLELTAQSDQRLGVVGQTGMGKTFLMERLLKPQPRVIVVDSKHRVNWPGYHLTNNPVAAFQTEKIIYRPIDGAPPEDWWMAAVEHLHRNGGGIIYIDELSIVCTDARIPKGLANAFRLGRELGVGVWWAAQEAVAIHNTTMRQADQLVLFYNQGASDRDKLTRIVGDMGEVTANLPKYDFVVFVRGETYDHDEIPTYRVEA
jgi:hypothetical protein